MLTDAQIQALRGAWSAARAAGTLGRATIEELYDHAAGFVPAASVVLDPGADGAVQPAPVPDVDAAFSAIDVGSGAGVPGLLLALRFPASRWRLVDANATRGDHARRAVRALAVDDRVEVVHGRVDDLGHEAGWRGSADLVTARLFGAPAEVAECAIPLLAPSGRLVVSTSTAMVSMWRDAPLDLLGAAVVAEWGVDARSYVAVERTGHLDRRYPRRPAKRRRTPLF